MRMPPHHRVVVVPRQHRPGHDDNEEEEEEVEEPALPTRTRTRAATSSTRSAVADNDNKDEEPTSTRSSSTRRATSTKATTTKKGGSSTVRAGSASRSPSATPTLPATDGNAESGSTRAIIGVGACVAAVAVLAVALWFVRRWYLRRHAAKHAAFRASLHDQLDAKRHPYTDDKAAASDRDASSLRPLMAGDHLDTPISPLSPAVIPDALRPVSIVVSAPPASPVPSSGSAPSLSSPVTRVAVGALVPAAPAGAPSSPVAGRREAAMVVRTFVPTMSDELPVTLGEVVFVEERYNDGWANCTTSSGQNGVVPIECLQSMTRPQRLDSQQQQGTDYRTSQRHSSLYGGLRTSGMY